MTYQPPRYPRTHPGRLYPGRRKSKHNPVVIVVGIALGATITLTGDDGSVAEVTLRSVKSFAKGLDPDNGLYVVFDVIVQQKAGAGSVNPLDFEFVADDGTSADSLSGVFSGCGEPSLASTDSLRAGQKRTGKMAFDVGSKKGALEWAPGGDAAGSWTTS